MYCNHTYNYTATPGGQGLDEAGPEPDTQRWCDKLFFTTMATIYKKLPQIRYIFSLYQKPGCKIKIFDPDFTP